MTIRKFQLASLTLAALLAACASPAPKQAAAAPPPTPAASPAPLAAAAAQAVAAPSPVAREIEAMKLDVPYTKYVLNNGLTLIVAPNTKTPTVTFHIWYHVGSKDEPKGRSGFAHLFEHLMYQGSEHFNDDFFKATQKIGATNQNGSTANDRTNYFQTVPKEGLDTILWLESDRMGYLLGAIDQHRLDEQRGVVQNEKRQGENQPYGTVNNHIVAATYADDHPYGHSVIGSMDDLNAAKLDDVRDWFRTWYGPSNAVLVLSGDILPEEAKAKVEKYFGEIPSGPPVSHPKAWVAKRTGAQRETMYDRVAAPRVYKIWNVPQLGDPDGELLDAAASALGGDKNARITKRLVHDEQVATQVAVGNGQSEIAGQFRVIVTPKPGADLKHIEAVIDEEMAKMFVSGPTQEELDRYKVDNVAGLVAQMQLSSGRASLLAEWETYLGDAGAWKASLGRTMAATPASVAASAKKWLSDGSYTLTVLPFPDYATMKPADRKSMPMPASVAETHFPKYQTATLSNGMKVMLVERHDTPTVMIRMNVETGIPADWALMKPGLDGLAVQLMNEGTLTRTGLAIDDALGAMGSSVSAVGGGEESAVMMTSLSPALDATLAIFADVARNPGYREEDLKRLEQQTSQAIRQQMRTPNGIAGRVMARALWGEKSPYGRLTQPEDVLKITREDVVAFHKRWFGPNNAALIVVGDTTLGAIQPKLEAAFKDWAPAPGKPADVAQTPRPDKPKVLLIDRPGSVQSVIEVGSTLSSRVPAEDQKLQAFNAMFGGNFTSRINMNLREDKHWSYGARTAISGGKGPRTFIVDAPVQTDATKGALIELKKELADVIGKRPPNAKELEENAKTPAILGLASRWETNASVVTALSDIAEYHLPPDYYDRVAAGYKAVTPADAEAMAKKLIPNQNNVWVIVGDRAKIEAAVKAADIGEVQVVDASGAPVK